MKGLVLEKIGGEYTLVDTIEKPSPGKGQILVKSLATAFNPVEGFQQQTGLLILSFPIVLGCDGSGVVVGVGEGVSRFKVGDKVFGCTRLGAPGYCTFQEFYLMDEELTFKNYGNLSVEQAATVGVGLLTACLGLISGTKIELKPKKVDEGSEWIVILGAAGAVGSYAVQVAKLCGYKVLAASSPANIKFVESLGADKTFNHRLPIEEQLKEIASITEGKLSKVFDASAMATETGMSALVEKGGYFSTTNDWMPIEEKAGIEIYKATLGVIGQEGSGNVASTNNDIKSFIPVLEEFLKEGLVKPLDVDIVGDVGVGEVPKGLEAFGKKKADGMKIVVRIAEE